ncbi:hypothetical protein D3C77_202310 [compost metagenome]
MRDHFFAQVALQVAGAPDQVIEDRARGRAVLEHDDDQLQARGPAAGQVIDQAQLIDVDPVGAQVLFDEGAGLGQVERQLGAFNFDDLVHDPQSGQAQRRIDPCSEHQVQVARALLEQFLNQFVRCGDFDVVVVVDDQVEFLAQLGGRFDDDRDAGLHRRHRTVFAQGVDVHFDTQAAQPLEQCATEGGVALVINRQRNPGNLGAGHEPVLAPLRQQGRLAIAGRTGDQRQFAVLHAFEPGEQGGAGHMARTDARGRKLGRDQMSGGYIRQRFILAPRSACATAGNNY